MTFYVDNYIKKFLKQLKEDIRTYRQKLKKVIRTVEKELEKVTIKVERKIRLSIARVKDAVRDQFQAIGPMLEDAFTVDSPQKAAQMAEIYGEELAAALYEVQLRMDGLQNAIIRAAAPIAGAFVPVVNTAIKADHPEYDWRTCLHASQQMMYGHKMDLFVLDLSFIGWYFVGSLCLGVGALWVHPYHETTRALFYEQLKQNTQ